MAVLSVLEAVFFFCFSNSVSSIYKSCKPVYDSRRNLSFSNGYASSKNPRFGWNLQAEQVLFGSHHLNFYLPFDNKKPNFLN